MSKPKDGKNRPCLPREFFAKLYESEPTSAENLPDDEEIDVEEEQDNDDDEENESDRLKRSNGDCLNLKVQQSTTLLPRFFLPQPLLVGGITSNYQHYSPLTRLTNFHGGTIGSIGLDQHLSGFAAFCKFFVSIIF